MSSWNVPTGIRLFDLIRALRRLELERRDGRADWVRVLLIRRARMRLARIQSALLADSRALAGSGSYPLRDKIVDLLNLFLRILEINRVPEGWRDDVEHLVQYWDGDCSLVPFRDATTKNMLVLVPEVAVGQNLDPDERIVRLSRLLDMHTDEYWSSIPLYDIDFSSVEHLTTPEDDPISLHCHEWTFGSCSIAPESFVLLPQSFLPDAYRTSATFLVSIFRFGGRNWHTSFSIHKGLKCALNLTIRCSISGSCLKLAPD